MKALTYLFIGITSIVFSQNGTSNSEFNTYWYGGKAEITSYTLEQARYGEVVKGHAVNIFVTEPFSEKYNTKADANSPENVTVLKMNATKKFNTGIYPYSIMTSSFLPVSNPTASLKISSSTQEWCGQEYIELLHKKDNFKLDNFSYFQGNSFRDKLIDKNTLLEDDIWSKIRITPHNLPQGNFMVLPSFVYLRFSHNTVKAYRATTKLIKGEQLNVYQIKYPSLDRTLEITFENSFPYKITRWTETYYSGWGANKKKLSTKATMIKTLNIPYWQKNKNKDLYLRQELGLEN